MSKEQIDRLISITKEKKQLLNRMYTITKIQMAEIDKGNIESLNEVMDEKDRIIEKIDKLDTSFLTIFSTIKKHNNIQDIDELSMEDYPNLEELKDVVGIVSSQLVSISLLDEKNQQNIKKIFEQTKMDLCRIKKGKKAYKGYNVPVANNILIDEKK